MYLAILQARMGSTRLPGKVLMKVVGKPLLQYECERVLQAKKIDKLIIATSTDPLDDAIETFAKVNQIDYFRGSPDDVLSRYYDCALKFKSQNSVVKLNIIRITGDCPIIDPALIDEVINYFEQNDCDYASNTLVPTYPDGMDIEICTFEALNQAYHTATYKSDREHVTLWIKHQTAFKRLNYTAQTDFSHLRMTVDEDHDFQLIQSILEALYHDKPDFTYLDAIAWMTKHPQSFFINSSIQRDEGLAKSLKEDGRI